MMPTSAAGFLRTNAASAPTGAASGQSTMINGCTRQKAIKTTAGEKGIPFFTKTTAATVDIPSQTNSTGPKAPSTPKVLNNLKVP